MQNPDLFRKLADARGWIQEASIIADEIMPMTQDIRELRDVLRCADRAMADAQEVS